MIRCFFVAREAGIILITTFELDRDDVFVGMIVNAARKFINGFTHHDWKVHDHGRGSMEA